MSFFISLFPDNSLNCLKGNGQVYCTKREITQELFFLLNCTVRFCKLFRSAETRFPASLKWLEIVCRGDNVL